MGCCSLTPVTTGIDEVGPDEIELLDFDSGGVWTLGETKLQLSIRTEPDDPPQQCSSIKHPTQNEDLCDVKLWGLSKDEIHQKLYTHPVRDWEGLAPHTYGDIIYSSLVSLHNGYSEVMDERYLVLFSFHLLILALDNSNQDLIYEGILPLSAIEVRVIAQQDPSAMFEISGPMVDSKIFTCSNAAEKNCWLEHIENRRSKIIRQQLSPSHTTLSYLLPCDESWKREEVIRYLLRSPILQWEGSPIQHMGPPAYLSLVYISNTERQGSRECLLMLFPLDLLILSVDGQRLWVKYEGRLPRRSIQALERSAQPERLEFELTGEMMEPLLVSCTYPDDYQCWIFHLQQPEKMEQAFPNHTPPPLIPKKHRS